MSRVDKKIFCCSLKNSETSEITNVNIIAETDEDCIIEAKKHYRNLFRRYVLDEKENRLVYCGITDFKKIELKYICLGNPDQNDFIMEERFPYEIEADMFCKYRNKIVTVNPIMNDPEVFKKKLIDLILKSIEKRPAVECRICLVDRKLTYIVPTDKKEYITKLLEFVLVNAPDYFYVEHIDYDLLSYDFYLKPLHYVTLDDLKYLGIKW